MIEVTALSKRFRLGSIGADSVRGLARSVIDRLTGKRGDEERQRNAALGDRAAEEPGAFWGLRDVSFSVEKGEVLGVVGRNGAGKSTLLKLLSRITEPTSGRAILRGRVASLLEVGTGFHPELTGRENIYLNGAVLGMKRAEIAGKFDEIVAFAELGAFLDTPVKRYSSGMFVRLAFAVAAHLEPEILLIDEVLAVGDAAFQRKCLGKMNQVATEHGRTVLFVSHNLGALRALCTSAILLENGRLTMKGKPADVIANYLAGALPAEHAGKGRMEWADFAAAPGNGEVRLSSFTLTDAKCAQTTIFEAGEPIHVEIRYTVRQRLRGSRFYISVKTSEGDHAFTATDHIEQTDVLEPGCHRSVFTIPGGTLNRRDYVISTGCDVPGERNVIHETDHLWFKVGGAGNQSSHFPETWPGIVCPRIPCKVERLDPATTAA